MDRTTAVKCTLIAALALALLVPVAMIRDLVSERQARRDDAVAGIALGWGKRQALAGPYLAVPYERTWTETTHEIVDGQTRERRVERSEKRVARFAAEALEWAVDAATSEKARGIYKARLYLASIRARGRFSLPERMGVAESAAHIRWGTPRLVVGVSDPRGLRSVSALRLADSSAEFVPGAGDTALGAGIHAPLAPLGPDEARTLEFEFSLELAGAEAFAVAPLGRDTVIAMRADWPHPSFQGAFLPARQEVTADGFNARWQISRYAAQSAERLAACERAKPCAALSAPELGVSFVEPVGLYLKLERAAKYGFLFIGLTFAAFLLFELSRRLSIHAVQYTLVGLALAMFFLLFTALAEHLPFALAYGIATFACVGLCGTYAAHVVRSATAGAAFGAVLAALYATLYALLSAEDYALLAGSLVLFGLLAAAMFATRRVDWYRVAGAAGD